MNNRTAMVVTGWKALNDTERADFDKAIEQHKEEAESGYESLGGRTMTMQTGPLGSSGCPCCGK